MSQNEPGLDLHDWETRWSELEEMFAGDPTGTLSEACDFIERVFEESGIDATGGAGNDELVAGYAAARETSDRVERGDEVDPGDIAAAIENLRAVYETMRATRPG
ncbi:MAG TPA: hypothetical protein VNI55_07180 [Gaiellaceae bacterium]|nr:hypothetical protein [Gaiellaceae bacterium]